MITDSVEDSAIRGTRIFSAIEDADWKSALRQAGCLRYGLYYVTRRREEMAAVV
jgi:hypothetical protein